MDRHQQLTSNLEKVVVENIKNTFPITSGDKEIKVKDIVADPAPSPYDYYAISEAKDRDKTYGSSIRGTVELYKDGKVIDSKKMKLATIPTFTNSGTSVIDGVEYQIDSQLRLRPGIYSRIKTNGDIEAHINPNGFSNIRLLVDPLKNKLILNVNQANINGLAVLRLLGITDQQMEKTFGKDIYKANIEKKPEEEIKKFWRSIYPRDPIPTDHSEIVARIATAMKNAKLDPKVTKITLGSPFAHLDGHALLRGFEKVVNVAKGNEEPDDRDALTFKTIHTADDFVNERLQKNKKTIEFGIKNKLHKYDDLSKIINSSHFNDHIFSFFNSSSLSEIPSQINPLAIINAGFKTTITGEGGITNEQAIVPEMQALHPTHLGFLDPINTPESKKSGVTLNLTIGTKKEGNELLADFKHIKSGKIKELSPLEAYDKIIALPDQKMEGKVSVIHKGKQTEVDADKVEYVLPTPYHAFTVSSQALPALHFNQANRAGMASRHINQAISLIHREAPLVQVKSEIDPNLTTEQLFGHSGVSLVAHEDLTLKEIKPEYLLFKNKKGEDVKMEYFNNFEMFNKAYLNHEIEHLKPGMHFKKGDVISDSNFTKNGTLALGVNLKTAYMPYKGLNFEDGIVISDSAAKKLTSSHIIQNHIDKNENIVVDKKKFKFLYPTKYTKKQLDKIGENGLAKPGEIIEPGDPYALVLKKNVGTHEDLLLNRLHKSLVQPYKDSSEIWDNITPGTVVKAINNTHNSKIFIKHETPAIEGDKLALRHGNKGVITSIIPDAEMPKNKDGEHAEVIISPLSVITRMSIGQMLENSASKIAKKTGKPYVIENFNVKESQLDKIKKDLEKNNISDTEELFDPETGKSHGQVMIGNPFVEKLFKTTKANLSAREVGSYDVDNKPLKGGDEGSKAVDHLTLYSLLSHGHRNIINEVSTIKGDGNAQFWQNLENGLPIPKPQIPFAYKKFEALLTGAGVNIKQDGNKKILTPLTDEQTVAMSGNNVLQNYRTIDFNLEPIKGGLFDSQITGGTNGQKWSRIDLAHPIVNPLFEQAVKSVLNLRDSDFQTILKDPNGHEKIKDMLSGIKIPERIHDIKEELPKAPKTKKEKLLKELKLLKSLHSLDMRPENAYVISKIPVIPPQFRPVYELPSGAVETSSVNHLYRDLGLINDAIKEFGPTPELSKQLYDGYGAIQGLTDPISRQNQVKGTKGIIPIIVGNTPKTGYFQSKVVRKQQDLSARATAILNNNLNMDNIAIPEKIAKVVYKPFAIKDLINKGYSHKEAEEHIDKWTLLGQKAIQASMNDRPILMNRAPSLHKFSIMAFKPKLTKGLSIETPGIITKPYSLDYDGDTLTLHVPVTEKSRLEALEMLPSKNLYNPRARTLNYTPDQEAIMGLYLKSSTQEGRTEINKLLPHDITVSEQLKKKDVEKILEKVAEKYPDRYNEIVTGLKVLGDNHATSEGFSLSLKDLTNNKEFVHKIYDPILKRKYANDKEKIDALLHADKLVKEQGVKDLKNNFVTMAVSGARGSAEQVKQITMAPGMMRDHNDKIIMTPVLSNYATGMNFKDYWTTAYSARKGSLDKQLMTAKPGALNKEIVNTTMGLVITEHDCKTHHGILMNTDDPNLIGRFKADDGSEITKSNVKNLHEKMITVRTPAMCEATKGLCQKCYGIDEFGRLPKIGTNVGIKAAQAISEPLTQAAMKTFHTGGTVSGGGGAFSGFESISNFLEAPETFKNKAVLSTVSGKVESVKPNPAGGFHVFINNVEHFIAPRSGDLLVKHGDDIHKGQPLNYGIPHPKEALEILGPTKGIQLISDNLNDLYKNSDIKMDRRNIETVVRGITGFANIKDEGTHPKFVKGDIIPLSTVEAWNKKANEVHELPIMETHGMILSQDYGEFKKGSQINSSLIAKLKDHHRKLKVTNVPIDYERTLIGVNQAPVKSNDWLSHLSYRYLKRGLQDGALYSTETDIHSTHPIPAFVTGQLTYSPNGMY